MQIIFALGYQSLLKNTISFLRVGDKWDEREELFRNHFSAFSKESILRVFTRFEENVHSRRNSWKNLLTKLDYSLVKNDESGVQCSLSGSWLVESKEELLSLAPCKHILAPGVWSLQLSFKQRTLAAVYFFLVGDVTNELPYHTAQETCSISTSSQFQSCHQTAWSTMSPDEKSNFLEN